MWGTGSPAVAIEHCHNPHTRPDVPVSDPKESVGVAAAHCHSTEEMIGENDTHYLFIRLQLVFEHKFHLAVIHQPCV